MLIHGCRTHQNQEDDGNEGEAEDKGAPPSTCTPQPQRPAYKRCKYLGLHVFYPRCQVRYFIKISLSDGAGLFGGAALVTKLRAL